MEKFRIRLLLLHYWKQKFKATDAAKSVGQVGRKWTAAVRTAQYWFKKFNEGCYTSLGHNEIPDRPLIVHSGAILNAVETNPSTSTRR